MGPQGLSEEWVWSDIDNSNTLLTQGATGGGSSKNFPASDCPWQSDAGITQIMDNNNTPYTDFRFSPDVSGMIGLQGPFYLDGSPYPAGNGATPGGFYGTSCVAPLYAGLMAVIQSAFGFSPGFLSPLLYQLGTSGSSAFNPVTFGDNDSGNGSPFFATAPQVGSTTWNPCAGWGSINGQGLLNGLAELLFPQQVYLVVDKNTFSLDEAKDLANATNGTATWNNAFWVVLEGFTPTKAAGATITLTGTFAGLSTVTLTPLPLVAEIPSQVNTPQQIWYPYSITFQSSAIATTPAGLFPATTGATIPYTLGASVDLGIPDASPAPIELLNGNNPFFTNVGATNNQYYWSQDLRVFTITPQLQIINPATNTPYPQLNDPNPTPDYLAFPTLITSSNTKLATTDPFIYITKLLGWLNGNPKYYTPIAPGAADPLDTLLPDQGNALTNASSVTPFNVDSSGNQYLNYNFAIARVRLFGTSGATTDDIVRVFFRWFTTLSNDTSYNTSTTYQSTLDSTTGLPIAPELGLDGTTI